MDLKSRLGQVEYSNSFLRVCTLQVLPVRDSLYQSLLPNIQSEISQIMNQHCVHATFVHQTRQIFQNRAKIAKVCQLGGFWVGGVV